LVTLSLALNFLNIFFVFHEAFIVKHFSDTVRYESQGFLEKNRDNVSKELVNTIRLSGMSFLKKIIDLEDGTFKLSKSAKPQTPGVKIVISASKTQVNYYFGFSLIFIANQLFFSRL
jgi:myosin heavy subunit